jgi:hypothetical protein
MACYGDSFMCPRFSKTHDLITVIQICMKFDCKFFRMAVSDNQYPVVIFYLFISRFNPSFLLGVFRFSI